MTRPLLLLLALAALVGLVLLATGSGGGSLEGLERDELAAPSDGSATAGTPTGEVEPDAPRQAAPGARRQAVQVQADRAQAEPPRLTFGEDHLDIIVHHMDGTPARSVTVLLIPVDSGRGGSTQLTSTDGLFRIEGLSPGLWKIHVSRAPTHFGASEDLERAHAVPHPGPPPEFVLYPAGSVSGTLLDDEEVPVAGSVFVLRDDGNEQATETSADGDTGEFSFKVLPAGTYELQARCKYGLSNIAEVVVEPGQATEGVILRLPPGGWLDVTVLDAHSDPVPEVEVVLLAEEDIVEGNQTDEQGHTRFGPLSPGTWAVAVVMGLGQGEQGSMLSASAEIAVGSATSIMLQPPSGGIAVSGSVTRASAPVGEMELYFFREGMGLVAGANMTESGEDGRYELLLRQPGAYQVMFQTGRPQALMQVMIPAGETFQLDLPLPGGRVSGRVIGMGKHGGRTPEVRLEREDGYLEGLLPDDDPSERPDDDGAFAFEGVRPGLYRLRLFGPRGTYGQMLTGIPVGPDEHVGGLDLSLGQAASLRVELSRSDGGALAGANLMVRTMAGTPVLLAPEPAGGLHTLQGLPPGRLLVSAQAADAVAVGEVRLESGRQGRLTLVLEPGATLEVSSQRGGQPFSAALRLYGPDGDEVTHMLPAQAYRATYTRVLSSSTRSFGPLPPGRYEATASARDGRTVRRTIRLAAGETRALVLEF
jgi:Carboxypeptidase regulatory-like domain